MKDWWLSNRWIGRCRQILYTILQKVYLFDDWHLEPINCKPYAREVISRTERYLREKEIQCVVEIGCGLGEIIGNIKVDPNKKCQKIGIDIDSNVIRAAKLLHPSITFLSGSFDQCKNKQRCCLIMVNFIHMIPEEKLKEEVKHLLLTNRIDLVIFDTFSRNENTEYVNNHRGETLFDEKFRRIRKSRAFAAAHGARRYIEYWERVDK